ncbi:MAG: hypothetical protein IJY90_02500 [Clostridia bacterium]|nr:hypothetical protein [Clostridia bacterium]
MGKKIEKEPIDEHFEKHMHDGHRGRLLRTVNDRGLEYLSDIQKLEFVLCFILPRGDVNPLAHRLLKRYQYLFNVMEAPVQDLMRVPGLGETAAMKLHALLEIFEGYQLDKFNNNKVLENGADLLEHIELLLRFKNEEVCYILGISPSGVVGNARVFSRGDAATVKFNTFDVANYIATYKVHRLIFVHNHPNGDAKPSKTDENTFLKINNMLAFCGANVYDFFIVGRNGIYSWNRKCLVRDFTQSSFELDCLQSNPKTQIENKG